MFSTQTQLKRRTPQNGTNREEYLSLLVDEYLNTSSYEAKCQVLANLANFAYDPINYSFIREVGVLDIFVHVLKKETSTKLLRFAIAGICNLCIDPLNAEYILTYLGLKYIIALLNSSDTTILADTITTLLYVYNEHTKPEIITPDVIKVLQQLKDTEDPRLSNLATIFLQDVSQIN
ncbi:armadillo repeat-containing protein 7 [Manduca sexta]|uniref:Armadillo repeat-containing protein 7 n=1 Tax=Manduca sexta TaxID=7130 RepID=A0A921Z7C1_MANSE|nr:armadillo repeat-containing protein 7 [Manduca sexta]XP_037300514.1 armadillo repeat-containing protein 7 [Manduca sexta]KAG6452683.1 hypothetical protein O3G_MSEX007717 [Manduca sexta]